MMMMNNEGMNKKKFVHLTFVHPSYEASCIYMINIIYANATRCSSRRSVYTYYQYGGSSPQNNETARELHFTPRRSNNNNKTTKNYKIHLHLFQSSSSNIIIIINHNHKKFVII